MVNIEVSGITEEELRKSRGIYTNVVARYCGNTDITSTRNLSQ